MTAISELPEPALFAAVEAAGAELSALGASPGSGAWSLGSDQLPRALRRVLALRAQVEGLLLAVLREADGRGVATECGARGTAGWVRSATRLAPPEARELLQLAQATDPQSGAGPGRCPATGAALRDGRIHAAQAKAIAAALQALPREVDTEPGLREQVETWLVDQADDLDSRELATAGRALRERLTQRLGVVDVDDPVEAARLAEEAERAIYDERTISRHRHLPGLSRVRMLLPEDVAGALFAALEPLAKPRRNDDGVPDIRTPGQRRADAFAELLDVATTTSVPDVADGQGSGRPSVPTSQLIVTTTLEALESRRPTAGFLDPGEPLSPGQLRRFLCDAAVIPVVLGGESQPLDVGRARRLFTPAQRAAMLVRDGGCAGLGCDPHPQRTHAHHFTEWGRHGQTNLGDRGLFCGPWHRRIHAEGWIVRLAANGHPELIPPAWVDPTRRPRQNHRFRDLPPPEKPRPHFRSWSAGIADALRRGSYEPTGSSRPITRTAPRP